MVAASTSYPDLRIPQYRIKRKPPPTIDSAEKYPSPDPADPFAPLWVLRNRTSSALGQHQPPNVQPNPYPTYGPYDSQDTLNNPIERRRSNPYLNSVAHVPQREPSPSPPKAPAKVGHYRPYSQLGGAQQAPTQAIITPFVDSSPSETHLELAKDAWPTTDARRMKPDLMTDSSGTETDSDASLPAIHVKIQETAPATISLVPLRRGASNNSTSGHTQSQSRLAKFLLPKKTNVLGGSGARSSSRTGHIDDGAHNAPETRRRGTEKDAGGMARKLSISPPVVSAVTLEVLHAKAGLNAIEVHSRSPTPIIIDQRAASPPVAIHNATESDSDRELHQVKATIFNPRPTASTNVQNAYVDAARGLPRPQPTRYEPKHEESCSEVDVAAYLRSLTPSPPPRFSPTPPPHPPSPPPTFSKGSNHKRGKTLPIPVSKTPSVLISVPQPLHPSPLSLYTASKDVAAGKSSSKHARATTPPPPAPPKMFRRRMSSAPITATPSTGPTASGNGSNLKPSTMMTVPSTNSISNSSIVNVSISTPSPAASFAVEEEAYTSPRRAPMPPTKVKAKTKSSSVGNGLGPGLGQKRSVSPFMRGPVVEVQSEPESRVAEREREKTKLKGKSRSEDEVLLRREEKKLKAQAEFPPPPAKQRTKHIKAPSSSSEKTKGTAAGCSTATCTTSASGPVSFPSDSQQAYPPRAISPPLHIQHPHPHPHQPSQLALGLPTPFPDINTNTAEYTHPTPAQLTKAAGLPVYCEDGTRVAFGALFAKQKTVVVFIRHFWCPLCQDYMTVVSDLVRPEMLVGGQENDDDDEVVWKSEGRKKDVRKDEVREGKEGKIGFVVISNGAHGMIAKYRQIFGLPFHVYTDPSLALYRALGMARDGEPSGHEQHMHYRKHHHRKGDNSSASDKEGGGYVKHGLMSGIAMVVLRAIRFGLPVWEKGGDVGQLGGEFVLGPGLTCAYAHKMQSTKGHAPVQEVLQAAGISLSTSTSAVDIIPPHKNPHSIDLASPPKEKTQRKRRESMKTVQEALRISRTNSVAQAPGQVQSQGVLVSGRNSVMGRHDSRSYSIGHAGLMSREEEELWMEDRQRNIEKLQERKVVRRVAGHGGISRAGSRQPEELEMGALPARQRSPPARPMEEEKIVYKAESRRSEPPKRTIIHARTHRRKDSATS